MDELLQMSPKEFTCVSTKTIDLILEEKQWISKPAPDQPLRRGFSTSLSKRRSVIPASAVTFYLWANTPSKSYFFKAAIHAPVFLMRQFIVCEG